MRGVYPTGFVKNILLYLAQKVGLELQDKPIYRDDYSDMGNISVTAVIANKVATLAMQDSTITIEGESARAKFLQGFLDYYLGDRMDVAAEVAPGDRGLYRQAIHRRKTPGRGRR